MCCGYATVASSKCQSVIVCVIVCVHFDCTCVYYCMLCLSAQVSVLLCVHECYSVCYTYMLISLDIELFPIISVIIIIILYIICVCSTTALVFALAAASINDFLDVAEPEVWK